MALPPDVDISPDPSLESSARIRRVNWRELALAGQKDTSNEWHRRLLESALFVEGPRAAADVDLVEGDPRRSIARIHALHRELVETEVLHDELKNPGPWNSGAVRLGSVAILCLLAMVYLTGIVHHGPVAAASFLCLFAVVAMWGDILWRRKRAADQWAHRNQVRDRLREAIRRLGTRSWVVPIQSEVMENTPHLDLLRIWIREVRQHLHPWRRKLDGLVPLDDVDGIPEELLDEVRPEEDEAVSALARQRIEVLSKALKQLESLHGELEDVLEDHRSVAVQGTLPAPDQLIYDLDEVRGWLRKAGLDPDRAGQGAQEWLEREPG